MHTGDKILASALPSNVRPWLDCRFNVVQSPFKIAKIGVLINSSLAEACWITYKTSASSKFRTSSSLTSTETEWKMPTRESPCLTWASRVRARLYVRPQGESTTRWHRDHEGNETRAGDHRPGHASIPRPTTPRGLVTHIARRTAAHGASDVSRGAELAPPPPRANPLPASRPLRAGACPGSRPTLPSPTTTANTDPSQPQTSIAPQGCPWTPSRRRGSWNRVHVGRHWGGSV